LIADRGALALLALCCFGMGTAAADVLEFAELRLQAGAEQDTYELTVRLPRTVAEAAELTWPAGCRQFGFRRQAFGHQDQLLYRARCDHAPAASAVILAPWRVDGARLTVDDRGHSDDFVARSFQRRRRRALRRAAQ
jgi:hypothetical protein